MAQIGLIYIGNFAQADTVESNWSAENPNTFLVGVGQTVLKPVITTVSTPLNDGIAYDDDNGQTASQITYDLGSGAVTATQDSVEAYNATIKLGNGVEFSTVVNIIQLSNGATFINESGSGIPLDGLSIQSVTPTSLYAANGAGWYTNRSIDKPRIVCFARDTLISTARGGRPVQDLAVGDLVLTQDHGLQPLVWRGASRVTAVAGACPVRIAANALGPGLPAASLFVSGQHRILLEVASATCGAASQQVFVPAKKLVGLAGIAQVAPGGTVEYHHIMCARHEVIFANGMGCESFFPGPEAMKALSGANRQRLKACLRSLGIGPDTLAPCRPVIGRKQLRQFFDTAQTSPVLQRLSP